MKYLVLYDIASPSRLRKVANIMESYGTRIQFSVFFIEAPESVFQRMQKKLTQIIDDKFDSIIYFSICESCYNKKILINIATPHKREAFTII